MSGGHGEIQGRGYFPARGQPGFAGRSNQSTRSMSAPMGQPANRDKPTLVQ